VRLPKTETLNFLTSIFYLISIFWVMTRGMYVFYLLLSVFAREHVKSYAKLMVIYFCWCSLMEGAIFSLPIM
jgi:hypothetical protein